MSFGTVTARASTIQHGLPFWISLPQPASGFTQADAQIATFCYTGNVLSTTKPIVRIDIEASQKGVTFELKQKNIEFILSQKDIGFELKQKDIEFTLTRKNVTFS